MGNVTPVQISVNTSDLRKIDEMAHALGMTRSEFIATIAYHFSGCTTGYKQYSKMTAPELQQIRQRRRDSNNEQH